MRLARLARIAAAAPSLAIAACTASGTAQERPAVLVEPSAQVREELAHAVAAEFGGSAAPLAEDALLHAPELVLERRFLPDSEGHAANGRETAPSEIFRLVTLDDGSCILVHLRNGHRKVLAGARCAAP